MSVRQTNSQVFNGREIQRLYSALIIECNPENVQRKSIIFNRCLCE